MDETNTVFHEYDDTLAEQFAEGVSAEQEQFLEVAPANQPNHTALRPISRTIVCTQCFMPLTGKTIYILNIYYKRPDPRRYPTVYSHPMINVTR